MRNWLICHVLFISVMMTSCQDKKEITDETNSKNELHSKSEQNVEVKMYNPVLMAGSTFGNYFQSLYKLGRYEEMLRFTSKELIQKQGRETVLEAYRKLDFAYEIQLKSIINHPDSSITLNYNSTQFATNKIIRIVVRVEKDTVRLVSGDFLKF